MQRLINRLVIALVLVSCIFRPLTVHAQDDPMDRPVPDKKFNNELLKNVLEELSREGGFTFSYNSKLLKKKQLVTLTIPAGTLRQALTDILGDGYSYAMMDNYVIIRRMGNDVPTVKAKREIKEPKREIKEPKREIKTAKREIKAKKHEMKRAMKGKKDVDAKMGILEEKREMKVPVKVNKQRVDPVSDTMTIKGAKINPE